MEELENESDLRILVADYLKGLSINKSTISGIIRSVPSFIAKKKTLGRIAVIVLPIAVKHCCCSSLICTRCCCTQIGIHLQCISTMILLNVVTMSDLKLVICLLFVHAWERGNVIYMT